jgi:hypothetical protein
MHDLVTWLRSSSGWARFNRVSGRTACLPASAVAGYPEFFLLYKEEAPQFHCSDSDRDGQKLNAPGKRKFCKEITPLS